MKKRMSLGEAARLTADNIRAILYILGVVFVGCSVALSVAATWFDRRMETKIAPLREILVWQLDQSGEAEKFRRYKEHRDSLKQFADPRISASGYPLYRSAD